MIKIGKTTLSKEAGKHHTLEKYKELMGNIPDLRRTDLEKLYYELGGEKKKVEKKRVAKDKTDD